MRHNQGSLDRDIRIALAAILGLVALFAPAGGLWQIVPALLGLVLFVTAALGVCPLYALFGLSTCPLDERRAGE